MNRLRVVKAIVGSLCVLPMLTFIDWLAVLYVNDALQGNKDMVVPAIAASCAGVGTTYYFLRSYIPAMLWLCRRGCSE